MNKFNLTMSVLVVATVLFFGFNIIQKVTYNAATGDYVSITYNVTYGEESYDDNTTSFTIGESEDGMFTSEQLTGLKMNDTLSFEYTLDEATTFGSSDEIAKGETVEVDATISQIVPADDESDSEASSEVASSEE